MSRRAGANPGRAAGASEGTDLISALMISAVFLMEQYTALLHAADWPERRRLAEEIDGHLPCVWADLGALRTWLGDGRCAGFLEDAPLMSGPTPPAFEAAEVVVTALTAALGRVAGTFAALVEARDRAERRRLAAHMDRRMHQAWTRLGDMRVWLALYSSDLMRAREGDERVTIVRPAPGWGEVS